MCVEPTNDCNTTSVATVKDTSVREERGFRVVRDAGVGRVPRGEREAGGRAVYAVGSDGERLNERDVPVHLGETRHRGLYAGEGGQIPLDEIRPGLEGDAIGGLASSEAPQADGVPTTSLRRRLELVRHEIAPGDAPELRGAEGRVVDRNLLAEHARLRAVRPGGRARRLQRAQRVGEPGIAYVGPRNSRVLATHSCARAGRRREKRDAREETQPELDLSAC